MPRKLPFPFFRVLTWITLALLVYAGWRRTDSGDASVVPLRVGFFPNITHAQAVIAQEMAAEGNHFFSDRLPGKIPIAWYAFNAGPTAIESLNIGSVELTYVGPNPALNGYVQTKGSDVRQLAGAAQGGSALVVQPEFAGAKTPRDFIGKKISTPQYGNTQDVACRSWLTKGGLRITRTGGDAQVIPMQNPELVQAFGLKNIDAGWTVEPWVSRLERDFNGKIVLEQPEEITTILVASDKTMRTKPEIAYAFAKAHRELTEWINAHPDEAAGYLHRGLERITKSKLNPELIRAAFKRIKFTGTVSREQTQKFVDDAFAIEMLSDNPNLDKFFQYAERR